MNSSMTHIRRIVIATALVGVASFLGGGIASAMEVDPLPPLPVNDQAAAPVAVATPGLGDQSMIFIDDFLFVAGDQMTTIGDDEDYFSYVVEYGDLDEAMSVAYFISDEYANLYSTALWTDGANSWVGWLTMDAFDKCADAWYMLGDAILFNDDYAHSLDDAFFVMDQCEAALGLAADAVNVVMS